MKRISLTVAALAVGALMLTSSADAQRVGISAGVAAPTGDFGDAAGTGYNIEGSLEFKPMASPVGFRIDVFYNNFGFSDELKDFLESDGSFRALGAAINAVLSMSGVAAAPYVLAGPSVTNIDANVDDSSVDTDGETKIGLQAGAGVKFPLSGMTSKLEGRYNHIFTEDTATSYFTLTFGVLFGGN